MSKLVAILVVVASFLLVAPVIESGTPNHLHVFQAVGDACDGGGGGVVSPALGKSDYGSHTGG